MFLSVKELELRKVRFDEAFDPGVIDFSGEELEQATPLRATGKAEMLEHSDGEIHLEGQYTVEMGALCDRCLGRARFPLAASFDLWYRPAAHIARDEEVAIDDDEVELAFYEGNGILLEDVLREQVLLALPMQRVCQDACKGICPECGRNRNEGECGCSPVAADDRWSALRNLKN
jgi:uncharacterized protein